MKGEIDVEGIAKSSRRTALVSMLGLLLIVLALLYSAWQLRSLGQEIEQKKTELNKLNEEIATRKQEVAELRPVALKGLGYKSTAPNVAPSHLEESLKAHAEAVKLASPAEKERRSGIRIEYFPKALDNDVNMTVVISSLEAAGFSMQQRTAKVPDVPTNSIWFGSEVRTEDIKLVAYTLIGAGVKLRSIKPFRSPSGQRSALIQVGSDASVQHAPPWTVERVQGTRESAPEPTRPS